MLQVNQLVGFGGGGAPPATLTQVTPRLSTATNGQNINLGSISLSAGLNVFAITSRSGASDAADITSVTHDGAVLTEISHAQLPTGSSAVVAALYQIEIGVGGATGDLVVNHNTNMSNIAVDRYRINDYQSATATANPTNEGASASSISVTPDIPSNGVLIAVAVSEEQGSTFTWTGATEDADAAIENVGRSAASASALPAEASRTVTATSSIARDLALAAAVWA